ncbi:hypothetical protein K439DRAFT_57956 [Ramaria rubella]|nr:hypothetical protein K439DRAFT_57956 [Ramaria rubella]
MFSSAFSTAHCAPESSDDASNTGPVEQNFADPIAHRSPGRFGHRHTAHQPSATHNLQDSRSQLFDSARTPEVPVALHDYHPPSPHHLASREYAADFPPPVVPTHATPSFTLTSPPADSGNGMEGCTTDRWSSNVPYIANMAPSGYTQDVSAPSSSHTQFFGTPEHHNSSVNRQYPGFFPGHFGDRSEINLVPPNSPFPASSYSAPADQSQTQRNEYYTGSQTVNISVDPARSSVSPFEAISARSHPEPSPQSVDTTGPRPRQLSRLETSSLPVHNTGLSGDTRATRWRIQTSEPLLTPRLHTGDSHQISPISQSSPYSSASSSLTSPSPSSSSSMTFVPFHPGYSPTVIHKIVEDTSITIEELEENFPASSQCPAAPTNSKTAPTRKWMCQWPGCRKEIRRQDRTAHILEHHGKKRFVCTCGASFARTQDQNRHLREQAACTTCERAVGRNGSNGKCPTCSQKDPQDGYEDPSSAISDVSG